MTRLHLSQPCFPIVQRLRVSGAPLQLLPASRLEEELVAAPAIYSPPPLCVSVCCGCAPCLLVCSRLWPSVRGAAHLRACVASTVRRTVVCQLSSLRALCGAQTLPFEKYICMIVRCSFYATYLPALLCLSVCLFACVLFCCLPLYDSLRRIQPLDQSHSLLSTAPNE
jgi:hypothetical protein